MPIIEREAKVAYYPMHKCGNTTIKQAIYEIEHGEPWMPDSTSKSDDMAIHRVYPTNWSPFERLEGPDRAELFCFAIVRDPVSRLLSLYLDKVVDMKMHMRGRNRGLAEELGLVADPTFPEFLDRLDDYGECHPTIGSHIEPLSTFLGTDASYYDRVYNMREIPEALAMLSERSGVELDVGQRTNKTRVDGPRYEVSAEDRAWLEKAFAEDYEIFGDYF
ncbi:sulfotransferase family 2 domain-containing protein [Mesobacterium pallidum]|uniref:sulfotransferase family 2 domain-containing protein n=1 Tax=Mesobacterium pallidum TaxID=2872037 RepID=UPI001EE2700C|nr:sulfotransferase family 2 domain-containing protein [Mesobacterium pallidum]